MKAQLLVFAITSFLLGSAANVSSQEKKGTPKWEDWDITIGLEVQYEPISPGMDETKLVRMPYLDIEYKNRYFIKSDIGIGAFLVPSDVGRDYLVGVAVGYDDGRKEADAPTLLEGLGSIDGSAEAIIFGEKELGPVIFELEFAKGLSSSGHNGFRADLSAAVESMVTERLGLRVGPFITYGDGKYIESYYGITAEQADRSAIYKEYKTSGGFESYGLEVNAFFKLSQNWSLICSGDYTRLLGDAKDSPIVKNPGFFDVTTAIVYTF